MQLIEQKYIEMDNPNYRYCHCSSIALFHNEPSVCWFGGAFEAAEDSSIYYCRSENGKWTSPKRIFGGRGVPLWNPVLTNFDDQQLHLHFKSGAKICFWDSYKAVSSDGWNFSEEKEFAPKKNPGDIRGSSRNKLLKLSNGRILAPGSVEGTGEPGDTKNRCFVDISDDNGLTWRKSAEILPALLDRKQVGVYNPSILVTPQSYRCTGVIQPALWESALGHVHMLMRSTETILFRSDSTDYGETWCAPYDSLLPSNNSGIDLTRLKDGRIILVYNPVRQNWGERTPLVVDVSRDNGLTWDREIVLENEPGEYSYPSIAADEQFIHVSYTANRKGIKYARISC